VHFCGLQSGGKVMQEIIVALVLAAVVNSAAIAEPLHTWTFPSGSELYALCLSSDPGEQGRCIGYIAGIIDGGSYNPSATLPTVQGSDRYELQQWCFPWAISPESVRDTVVNYLRKKDAAERKRASRVPELRREDNSAQKLFLVR